MENYGNGIGRWRTGLGQGQFKGRVENMFDSFDDNHIKSSMTLETIQEGLKNSIKEDQQAGANGSAKHKKKKSDDATKEDEHFGELDEALEDFISMVKQAATTKKRIEEQLVSQDHLAQARSVEEEVSDGKLHS